MSEKYPLSEYDAIRGFFLNKENWASQDINKGPNPWVLHKRHCAPLISGDIFGFAQLEDLRNFAPIMSLSKFKLKQELYYKSEKSKVGLVQYITKRFVNVFVN